VKRGRLAAFVVTTCALVAWTPSSAARLATAPVKVIFVDVGAGDGVVMRVGDATIISDIGEFNIPRIYEALKQIGADDIDVAILSHPHDDHIKNFELLLESRLYPVRRVLLSRNEHWRKTKTNRAVVAALTRHHVRRTYVRAGETYEFGGAKWTILNPPKDEFLKSGQEGNASIVYLLEVRGRRLLFTGDIERAGERAVVSRWTSTKPVDLLLVTHHGSNNASHDFFLNAVRPKVGVISVGPGHGHPSIGAIRRLREARMTLWCTHWNGDVTATISASASARVSVKGTRVRAAWWIRSERKSRGPCVGRQGEDPQ
jgi:competence protein ComEC